MEQKTKNVENGRLNLYALVCTVLLLTVALALIVASSVFLPHIVGGTPPQPPPKSFDSQRIFNRAVGMEFFLLRLLLATLNVILVICLLYIYVRDYIRLRSNFTLGLIAFLFSFLLYAISTIPLIHIILGPYVGPSIFSFIPLLFSAIGLIIFAKVSNE